MGICIAQSNPALGIQRHVRHPVRCPADLFDGDGLHRPSDVGGHDVDQLVMHLQVQALPDAALHTKCCVHDLDAGQRLNDVLQERATPEKFHLTSVGKRPLAVLVAEAVVIEIEARRQADLLELKHEAAKLDVARLKSRIGPSQPEAIERITHLTGTLNNGIALKRRIVEDLRPSSLSHLGLVASLEILAREFEERSEITVSTDLETVELGGSAQLTTYRLVQESLTNIGKYAKATQIVISLINQGGYCTIEVSDNGSGFDTGRITASSHGINGMRHRVEAAGGKLTVISTPGAGTRISAVLPKG